MIHISQVKIPVEKCYDNACENEVLLKKSASILKIGKEEILKLQIDKKALDARKKPRLFYVYSVLVETKKEPQIRKKNRDKNVTVLTPPKYEFPSGGSKKLNTRPVIIGMGPAGLFCGYMLAKHGYRPILLERGKKVEDRMLDVQNFWDNGRLLLHSNVQFGEGGAGTFSDGKLNTLVKDKTGRNKEVLKIFVECGAPPQILYDSKPHIGTDILMKVVACMRKRMLEMGADMRYESTVTDFIMDNHHGIKAVVINHTDTVATDVCILAIGHSARDTFLKLYEKDVPMAAKDFAVGFRVQHLQEQINLNQYGMSHAALPAAPYKLAAKTSSGRGVYSFCMCPGGYVVNASSENGRTVVNGMSYSKRDSGVANSAIIVSVTRKDFEQNATDPENVHPLSGVCFQRQLEESAFALAKGRVPIQYFDDFCKDTASIKRETAPFEPCIKGEYAYSNLRHILTEEMNEAFMEGMHRFGTTISGFDSGDCLLAGVESRTSSPVRIHRDSDCESKIAGLYPCGEGAGYAGGITSAAMDGLAVAEAIAKKYIL